MCREGVGRRLVNQTVILAFLYFLVVFLEEPFYSRKWLQKASGSKKDHAYLYAAAAPGEGGKTVDAASDEVEILAKRLHFLCLRW